MGPFTLSAALNGSSMQMHALLKDHLEQASSDNPAETIGALAALVNDAYEAFDRERARTERSMTTVIKELSEARALIEATFENIEQGVMMIDAAGCVRLFNPQVCRLLSLSPEALAARPRYVSLAIPASELVEETQTRELVTRDGKRLELIETPIRSGGFVQTYLDVTERRQREEQIRLAQAEFRTLFDNAFVGIYRSDLEGRINRVNPALARLHGFDNPEEFFAVLKERGFSYIYPDEGQHNDFIRKVVNNGRVASFTREIRRLKSGSPIWVTETAWTVAGPDGASAYIEATVADATAERIAQRRVAYLAHHDPMTGLANREVFNKELTEHLDPQSGCRRIALHCIDLDRFKMVNDTLGHICGDILLQVVSHRLRNVTDGQGLVARIGGDEFAFIQAGPVDLDAAVEMAGNIVAALSEPFEIEGKIVHAGATIGIALAPDHGTGRDDLFRNADLALCEGKAKERGRVYLFDPALAQQVMSRQLLETELRFAWAERQFHLVFQPIVDVENARPSSFEALLRWDRPGRPPVSPAVFIPLAEEIGLISDIGAFVLMEACRKVRDYDDSTSVSVNASAVQFRDRSIVPAVRNALAATGLEAGRLIIEITESLLLLNDEATMECMDTLCQMGVRLSLDDFGVGYSALSYLARFRFNEVKIDRAFIAKLEESPVNAAIIRAILDIGKDVGMVVIAEGVETREQAERLQAMGCVNFQGYLFGKPSPELLERHKLEQALCA